MNRGSPPVATAPPTLILALLAALGLVATNIYLPSIPAITEGLATTVAAVQTTFTVYLVTFSAFQLLVGPWADHWGRRPVLVGGLLLYTVASLGCLLAQTIDQLIAARILQAVGVCAAAVVSRAVVRDVHDGLAIFRTMAVIAFFVSFVPGTMPAVGGVLQDLFGWRAVFGFVTAVGLALLVWSLRFHETLATPGPRPTWGGVAARYTELLRLPAFVWPAALAGLPSGGLFAYFAGSPVVFMEALGLRPSEFGILPAIAVTGVMAGSVAARQLPGRLSHRALLGVGVLAMNAGALAMLALALLEAMTVAAIIAAVIVYLFGMGILIPTGSSLSLQAVSAQRAGAATALSGSLQMGFAALGTLFVSLIDALPGLDFAVVMVVCGFAAVAALVAAARALPVHGAGTSP